MTLVFGCALECASFLLRIPWLFVCSFVYIPTSFTYIFLMWNYGSSISPEAAAVPKYKFAVMGALDSLSGVMQVVAIAILANGSLVTLLLQSAIPFSMVISRVALKTRYTISQYVGAVVVVLGLVVVLLPSFISPESNASGGNPILWSCILMLSCVPMAISSVYKEMALDDVDIDVVYLNGWVALFQLLAAVPLLYPSAYAQKLDAGDVWENVYHGLLCAGGVNSVTDGPNPDDCARGPLFLSIYLVFNLAYNILIIYLLKYGGSNILWLSITATVPLVNVVFTIPGVPDGQAAHWENWVGLVLIMGGLITYRFWDKLVKRFAPQWLPKKSEYKTLNGDVENLGRSGSPSGVSLSDTSAGTDPVMGADGLLALDEESMLASPGTPGGVSTPGRGTLLHVQRKRKDGKPRGGNKAKTSEAPY